MIADAAQSVRVAIISYAETVKHFGVPPTVEPVAVVQDYALADWTAGRKEGEALLVRRDGKWKIVAFENSSLADAHFLAIRYRVPAGEAAALVKTLIAAEKSENVRP